MHNAAVVLGSRVRRFERTGIDIADIEKWFSIIFRMGFRFLKPSVSTTSRFNFGS